VKILIVGGAHQGKADYARRRYPQLEPVERLHLRVREVMEAGGDPAALAAQLEERGDWLAVCDEVGGGVVPVDAFDRRWREEVGRLCCALAERADVVEQITCGLPLRLKGREHP